MHPERGVSADRHRLAGDRRPGARRLARARSKRASSRGTSNVGVIHGGAATNVVTDRVELRAEARSHDPKFRARIVREIEQAFDKAAREVRNDDGRRGRVTIEGRLDYESFRLTATEPCVEAAAAADRRRGPRARLRHRQRRPRRQLAHRTTASPPSRSAAASTRSTRSTSTSTSTNSPPPAASRCAWRRREKINHERHGRARMTKMNAREGACSPCFPRPSFVLRASLSSVVNCHHGPRRRTLPLLSRDPAEGREFHPPGAAAARRRSWPIATAPARAAGGAGRFSSGCSTPPRRGAADGRPARGRRLRPGPHPTTSAPAAEPRRPGPRPLAR